MSEIKRIKCGSGNCYLVSDNNRAILVDTGSVEYREVVHKACQPYQMSLIVLTHPHWDHAENAATFSEEWNCPVLMGQEDEELFEDCSKQTLYADTLLGRFSLWISLPSLGKRKVAKPKNIIYARDGLELAEYGITASILSLPGHTNGHIGVNVEERELIVGDAMSDWITPTVAPLFHNKEKMLESVRKIQTYNDALLYFGHGKPAKNRHWI